MACGGTPSSTVATDSEVLNDQEQVFLFGGDGVDDHMRRQRGGQCPGEAVDFCLDRAT
jgi:hypothetical protein